MLRFVRHGLLILVSLGAVLIHLEANASSPQPRASYLWPQPTYQQTLIELVNKERLRSGLLPLKINESLTNAAQWSANDMATNDYISGKDSLGRLPRDRAAAAGYNPATVLGESRNGGAPTPQEVFQGWMNRPDHRANLYNPLYVETGVGYARNISSTYEFYWVQDYSQRNDELGLVVNGEALTTTLTSVRLDLVGDYWPQEVRFSNDQLTWGDWQPITSTYTWNLAVGPAGQRTVWAELRETHSPGRTEISNDQIYLIQDAPPFKFRLPIARAS